MPTQPTISLDGDGFLRQAKVPDPKTGLNIKRIRHFNKTSEDGNHIEGYKI